MVVDPMPPSSKNQGPLVGFALIAIGTKWALDVADHDFVKFDQQLVMFEEIASKTVKTITRGTMRRHMIFFFENLFVWCITPRYSTSRGRVIDTCIEEKGK
jgi:hypothetical protein